MKVKVGDRVAVWNFLVNDKWGRVVEVSEDALVRSYGSVDLVRVEFNFLGIFPYHRWYEETDIHGRKYSVDEQIQLIDKASRRG